MNETEFDDRSNMTDTDIDAEPRVSSESPDPEPAVEAPEQPDAPVDVELEEEAASLEELARDREADAEAMAESTDGSGTELLTEGADEARAEAEELLVEAATEVEDSEPVSEATTTEEAAEPRSEVDTEEAAEPLSEAITETPEPVSKTTAEATPAPVSEAAPEEPEPDRPPSPFDGPGDWYVVHTYAGYENKVRSNLQSRIGSMQMEDKIFDVVIPMEDVMEIKGGKKQVVQRKVFPGYLLVKMIYDNDSWYVVRNTPGVTGFVSSGTGTKPTPLSRREVEKILAVKEETQRKPEYRLEWEEGDVVRIIAGPFADFQGTIDEINVEQSKLKVLVNIFDRETPVELAFDQVAKA
jgi:transcription termination/antitermination protein NusG